MLPSKRLVPALLRRSILHRCSSNLSSSLSSSSSTADGLPDIAFDKLVINRTQQPKTKPAANSLKFGAETTDHMLQISWRDGEGWSPPEIAPVAPFRIHPCAQVLHYGTECFEGMKAYKGAVDRKVRLFRPEMNMERLSKSASRLAFPEFDKVELLECIKELVRLEKDWVPEQHGFSLYVRPSLISTYACLGVQAPREVKLFVVMSPVGAYFSSGLQAVHLFVDTKNVRAFPGGVGDRKLGGNYGPCILPQIEAARRGCSQVLFVREDDMMISEAGSMNMFFLLRKSSQELELVTPALDGTVLAGITRDTVIQIARCIPRLTVSERFVSFAEIKAAAADGQLLEAFGTGTACMIQPVSGLLEDNGNLVKVPYDPEATKAWIYSSAAALKELRFSLSGYLTRTMMDIHYGYTDSKWSVLLDDE